jgi:hypothetical protein
VLDRCRIRWGQVTAIEGDRVVVSSRPLEWNGRELRLGRAATEVARSSVAGVAGISVGDWVSLHWDWVCDRLTDSQLRALRAYTMRHLDLVNHKVERSGPAIALDG